MSTDETILDRLAIRELVENWSIYRDNREWERFLTVWHDDGVMMTTWGGKATPQQFVEAATKGFAKGDRMLHIVGGVTSLVEGDRGFAMSKLRIQQRGPVEGVICDVVCIGVNFDFMERRDGRWGLVLRQPVYERDYLDPVDPNQEVELNPEIMERRPDGYQRLAYLQEGLGYTIKPDMPTEVGPGREALVAARAAWLRGEPLAWPQG
ncbi:MAG TPA: nuclear transport factor 2 family protein [Solirubrobacterales bacterium]|nr:nuclear transport factor 2 family protein [Solirubrobacterales bacterium]